MAETKTVIVDTGGANLASLKYAFSRCGEHSVISADAAEIRAATHVVLPGVGAAGDATERLEATQLATLLPRLTQPVLGICLGMHLLGTASEENETTCLGIVSATARRLPAASGRPVPHMGWNRVERTRESVLLDGLPSATWFYFVHSYAMPSLPATVGTMTYGQTYSAVLEQDNFFATQFHPERSAEAGERVLRNFLRLAA